jgi:hypothetical protein
MPALYRKDNKMEYHKSRLLVSNVLILSLLLLLIAGNGGGIRNAEASVGAWSIVTSPNPGSSNNYLRGVSLADSTHVWAVGSYLDSLYRTLVVKWNGTSWAQETTTNPVGSVDNELYGVHARTVADVWAVGNSGSPGTPRPIILHRTSDITGWVSLSTPYTAGHSMYLRGVSAVSANLAWAVGFDGTSPLIFKWDGTSWSTDTTVPSITAQLRAVSAVNSNLAFAVGSTGVGNTGDTVILKWNGTAWNQESSVPSPGTTNNGLSGVKGVSSNEAYAVGYSDSGSGHETLVLKWDGTDWDEEVSANPDTTDGLEAVDTDGSIRWAVGESRSGGNRTLTLKRNNTTSAWDAVSSPNNNSNNHFLHGITMDPAIGGCDDADMWAVGDYDDGSGFNTLIMQYTYASSCGP